MEMNEILISFLFEGDNFIPKVRLRQPRIDYSVCGSFIKTKKKCKT